MRLKFAFLAALATHAVGAAPARAAGTSLTVSQLAISVELLSAIQMMLASQNQCITYSYDANGNRLSAASGSIGTATWGSSAYPCFLWDT